MNEIEETKGNHRQAVDQSPSPASAEGDVEHPRERLGIARQRQVGRARKQMRGFGTVYHPAWFDQKTGERKESPIFWIKYYHNKKVVRESSHSTKESDARKLLKKRFGEIEAGRPVGPDAEKTTFSDIATMLKDDYKANGRRSLPRIEDAIEHLREYFGDYRAVEITGDKVTAYKTYRQDQRAANSTINNELSALSRMFTLGIMSNKVAGRPHIEKLAVNNTRTGFFENAQFAAILKFLPEHYHAVVETGFVTGWRMADELFTRQRHHVDLKAGWLRLDPGETKNNEGRMFPLTPRLREVLEKQIAKTEALQKAKGEVIPWLFHRHGKPIKGFRKAWKSACKLAGIPGKIPHDFRRTAVRNLERAGVPRSAAMKMVGHKTQAIYQRYAIADESMLKDAAEKLNRLHEFDQAQTTGKVRAK